MFGSPKGKVVLSAKIDYWMFGFFKIAIWVVLAALFLGIFYHWYYQDVGIYEPDAFDYAQIARNNANGNWFATNFIRPVAFWIVGNPENMPDISNPPLYSLYLTPFVAILGSTDRAILAAALALFFLTLLLLFIFAQHAFGKQVAFYAMFFYFSCTVVLMAVFSGLPVLLSGFLILLLIFLLYFTDDKNWWLALIAGAVTGLCYLTSYIYWIFVIPALIYLIFALKQKRIVAAVGYVLLFALVISPWLIRNASVTGDPFFSLRKYNSYQLAQVYSTPSAKPPAYNVGTYGYIRSVSPDVLQTELAKSVPTNNFLRELRESYRGFINGTTANLLVVFFLAGIFFRYRNERIERVRFVFYGFLFLIFFSLALIAPDTDRFVPFAPFIILMGTAFFFSCLERIRPKYFLTRIGIIGLFILINLYASISILKPNDIVARNAWAKKIKALSNTIKSMTKEDEAVMSDFPWMVAWYADRDSIWMPPQYEDMKRIKAVKKYSMLHLQEPLGIIGQDKDVGLWREIMRQKRVPPMGFPLKEVVNPMQWYRPTQGGGEIVGPDGMVVARDQQVTGNGAFMTYISLFADNQAVLVGDEDSWTEISRLFEEKQKAAEQAPEPGTEKPAPVLQP